MVRKKKQSSSRESCCPLTASEELRMEADQVAKKIKDHFPRGLARPALRALAGAGYTSLNQLRKVKDEDLLKLHGMGPNARRIIREALKR